MIELKKVSKAFGEKKVINGLDLRFQMVKQWQSLVLLAVVKQPF